MPAQRGETKEYGFNLSVFEEKLTIRFNTFQTNQTNVSQQPSVLGGALYNTIIITADNWATEANVNPQLAAQQNANLQQLLGALPQNYLDLWNWKVAGTAPNLTTTHTVVGQQGISDTTDFQAKGLEMDVIYTRRVGVPAPTVFCAKVTRSHDHRSWRQTSINDLRENGRGLTR